jgi:hypothetical protein
MSKDEAASPTVLLLILTCVLDAKKRRCVVTVDIPHAFVQTPNQKVKYDHPPDLRKIKGKLAEVLLMMDPQLYGPFITEESGVPVIHTEILKTLYGMIKSPLLFYRNLGRIWKTPDLRSTHTTSVWQTR